MLASTETPCARCGASGLADGSCGWGLICPGVPANLVALVRAARPGISRNVDVPAAVDGWLSSAEKRATGVRFCELSIASLERYLTPRGRDEYGVDAAEARKLARCLKGERALLAALRALPAVAS